jgi:ABC-2 type transport system permease protein
VMPFAVILLAIFSLGVGLLLESAAAFFADMMPVYEVILTIWMYATPIIYPIEILPPPLIWLERLNPLYYMVTLFRDPLFMGTVPPWYMWAAATLIAVFTFLIGGLIFTSKSNEYAYRL